MGKARRIEEGKKERSECFFASLSFCAISVQSVRPSIADDLQPRKYEIKGGGARRRPIDAAQLITPNWVLLPQWAVTAKNIGFLETTTYVTFDKKLFMTICLNCKSGEQNINFFSQVDVCHLA